MRRSSEVIEAINELELGFPVDKWRFKDIDLWPAYRVVLYTRVTSAFLLEQSDSRLARLSELIARGVRPLWRIPCARWRDRKMSTSIAPGKSAVILSDGISFSKIGDVWYDRIADPVVGELEKRGHSSLKLTPLSDVHTPRFVSSSFIQPTIDRIKLSASWRVPRLQLPDFDAFYAAARAKFGSLVPDQRWLAVQASRLDLLAAWSARTLKRSEAGYAFVNTYYSLEGLSFVQGARRAMVRSIDLQHGMQGPHHVAYSRWKNVPTTGYSSMPDEFWVWSDHEAQTIKNWLKPIENRCVRVIGNPWLTYWQGGRDASVSETVERARSLRDDGKIHVLACLTWGVADEETAKLVEAARLSAPWARWWWRLHPVESGKTGEMATRLDEQAIDASSVELATNLPLYSLFLACDVVVAHSSTVIREAAQFGLRSVVTSDYGAEFHSDLVRDGRAIVATEAQAIASALDQIARSEVPDRAMSAEADKLGVALDAMFGEMSRP